VRFGPPARVPSDPHLPEVHVEHDHVPRLHVRRVPLVFFRAVFIVVGEKSARGRGDEGHPHCQQSRAFSVRQRNPTDVRLIAVLLGTDVGMILVHDIARIYAHGGARVPVPIVLVGASAIPGHRVEPDGQDHLHPEPRQLGEAVRPGLERLADDDVAASEDRVGRRESGLPGGKRSRDIDSGVVRAEPFSGRGRDLPRPARLPPNGAPYGHLISVVVVRRGPPKVGNGSGLEDLGAFIFQRGDRPCGLVERQTEVLAFEKKGITVFFHDEWRQARRIDRL
jgi:hypothetical protein